MGSEMCIRDRVGSVRAVRLQVATPYLRPRTKTNMATLEIDYQPDLHSDHCIAYITLEPKSIDKDATLQVIGEINVKDPRPLNNSRVLFKKSFRTTSAQMEVELPARFDRVYSDATVRAFCRRYGATFTDVDCILEAWPSAGAQLPAH